MVNLLFAEDDEVLAGAKPVRTMYDPACGTGGMLTGAQNHLRQTAPDAVLEVFGQELNPETWAICRSDLMIKGDDPSRIVLGNSLTGEDGYPGQPFDYMLANPPFGVDWKKYAEPIIAERDGLGDEGRYGPGLPRVSDGSLLFLLHMLSKMKPVTHGPNGTVAGGTRLAIVSSGSPLFAGAAGGGESEIRRWIIENDYVSSPPAARFVQQTTVRGHIDLCTEQGHDWDDWYALPSSPEIQYRYCARARMLCQSGTLSTPDRWYFPRPPRLAQPAASRWTSTPTATSTTYREDPRMNDQMRRDDLPDTSWASDALCVDMPLPRRVDVMPGPTRTRTP